MSSVQEVHDAAAILQDAGQSTAALIAYVSPSTVDADAVTAACAARLPHYMVPAAVVCLEVVPRLSNGKVRLSAWWYHCGDRCEHADATACKTHTD